MNFICTVVLYLLVKACSVASTEGQFKLTSCNSTTCCYSDGLGCFDRLPPFDDLPLPEDPEKIAPDFWLYEANKNDPNFTQPVPHQTVNNPAQLDGIEGLVVLTHGYDGNMLNTPWHDTIIVELLKTNLALKILFIEWSKGADKNLTPSGYKQAASNTRIVAAMTAHFLKGNPNFSGEKAHCIGFSLGAHLCGFMAKIGGFKWRRLTALDPAKPHFTKDNANARIDKSDAQFVDVMHTSTDEGLQIPVGHVDFWVNGGKHQPGCGRFFRLKRAAVPAESRLLSSAIDWIEDYVACSHERAAILFAASIKLPPKCSFPQFCPCTHDPNDDDDIKASLYRLKSAPPAVTNATCSSDQQQILGYGAIQTRLGSFCGSTATAAPFYLCQQSSKLIQNIF